ncbi:MAG: hypothetical protein NTV51_20475, partial [Verrucomicrobia bacterium]|nr:hypothetical protein [Verrucomicrobiota bacterium]
NALRLCARRAVGRLVAPGLLLLLPGAAVMAAEGAPPLAPIPSAAAVALDPAIELPKFEVVDSRVLPPPEAWRYAAIPGFEVLSNISARETNRFVKDFLLLQEVVGIIMPAFRASDVAVPTSLILTGRGKSFDRFMPEDRGDDRFRTNSLFFDDPERGAIVVDFALAELQLEDNTTEEADPYRSFYKEYFRYLIRRHMGAKSPAWFEEGLVQIFASIDFNKKWITFAQIGDGFGGPRTGDFNRMLAQRAILPMEQFLQDPPKERGTFWSAQCYGFVHMCLYGRNQKYQKGFIKFLGRITTEAPTEAVFKECFGRSYKEMSLELRSYIDFTDYKAMQYTAKKGESIPDPPPFTLRDATDAESGRIVGEVLRFGGHTEEARNALIAPYQRGERDPQLLAALGLAERLAGRDDRASKFLNAAATAKVERPRAYLELARLRYSELSAKPAAGDKLSDAQVTQALAPLLVARTQRPPMAMVYAMIAEVWTRANRAPTREEFNVVLEGVQTFPRSPQLVLQATMLAVQRNFAKEALLLAKHGQRIARDSADRTRFEMLEQSIQRDAAPETAKPEPAPAPKQGESYLPKLP